MMSISFVCMRVGALVLVAACGLAMGSTPALGQPVDGSEAPAEYQRDAVRPDDPAGTTDEVDAADAQAE